MSLYENNIGINITTGKMQLVEVSFSEENFILENVDEEYFSDFLDAEEKETKLISILQNALNEILLRKPLSTNNVSVTLPNEFFKVYEFPFEKSLLDNDLLEFYKWNLSLLLPMESIDEFVIRYFKSEVLETVFVTAIKRKILKAIHKFVVRNNLQLRFIDNAHFAANNIIYLEPFSEQDTVLSLYVSENSCSLSLIKNNNPFYFVNKKYQLASELLPLLLKEFNKLENRGIKPGDITASFISGQDINDTLLGQIQELLNLPIVRFNPFNKLTPENNLSGNKLFIEKNNSFSSAMGVTLRIA